MARDTWRHSVRPSLPSRNYILLTDVTCWIDRWLANMTAAARPIGREIWCQCYHHKRILSANIIQYTSFPTFQKPLTEAPLRAPGVNISPNSSFGVSSPSSASIHKKVQGNISIIALKLLTHTFIIILRKLIPASYKCRKHPNMDLEVIVPCAF